MAYQIAGDRLTSLFRPRSVALVGASDKSVFSQIAYHNLVQFGFAEHTYLVSRRGTPTHGQPTVTSCAQIGEPVDVAYLMVPQAGLLEALDDAAAAGIRNACVLSSGYAEAGEAGRAVQAELADHAAGLGMVLLGPNHLGFANLTDGVPVCSIPGLPAESGPVALLSQSGASSSAMVDFATMANVGLSYLVTLGNEAMISAGHVLDYLVDDPGTQAVAIFMETVRDPETFRRAARRAAQAGKAIVVLKAGSSVLSARTAAAHTGALVGDDRVIDAVFADLGVIRVDSIEDMLITAGAAAALGRRRRGGQGRPRGRHDRHRRHRPRAAPARGQGLRVGRRGVRHARPRDRAVDRAADHGRHRPARLGRRRRADVLRPGPDRARLRPARPPGRGR